ncbi:deoxyribonuclease IV [Natronobacterium gregoryi]|uniref:Probable endonuclease 4 n=2 Tax=Natronobacterium gregoryi TaxID=44930 RepID=L0AIP9_NATGS|nr:deoxyribonuclease IV [Natronobacterium gregoryi]AFZ73661.1 apurinic endonuclease APN1 [Natronobacterium gregoryi SP2]ELY67855.1 apurinic endonuclease Apn1 [Natronobacterium gregoryi SP2]PLK19614.1 endonuclease IV [Natronobacterium gregoryi SP2]SFJ00491.1 Endonuclease IV [Natronobacterium gregoryi]
MNVGAHVSISGSRVSSDDETPPYDDIRNAVHRQRSFGGNCGQIFTTSPQVWAQPEISNEAAGGFREESDELLEGPWVIHSSYLVNLCTPKEDLRRKSKASMQAELDAAEKLGVPYVNVHLGAHTGAGVEGGLDNAAGVIDDLDVPADVQILIESDAGSGTKLGGEFEHLAGIIDRTETDIGICIDTAHTLVAGNDLTTPEAVDETVGRFDDVVGLEYLEYIHLNDSKHDVGTHKDEHAHIGEGYIGEDGIQAIVTHPDLRDLPFALETPTEDGRGFAWNIEKVKELRDSK